MDSQVYPPPPFPKRLQKQKFDKQFAKFLDVFKKLQINIPFAEALEQMPSYAKFMKGILSRKLKLEELETVALTEECSAVLQQNCLRSLKIREALQYHALLASYPSTSACVTWEPTLILCLYMFSCNLDYQILNRRT